MDLDLEVLEKANMTQTQLLMWTGQMLSGKRPVYNMGFAIGIDADVNPELFRQAYDDVVAQSDNIRSVFRYVDGGPRRIVLDYDEFEYDVPVLDFSGKPDEMKEWMQARLRAPINLKKRLFDAALLRTGPESFTWFICNHHLICDGWSLANFVTYVGNRYAQLEKGDDSPLELPRFDDFVEREVAYYGSEECQASSEYWHETTKDSLPPLSMYGVRADSGTNEFLRVHRELGVSLIDRMKASLKDKTFRAFSMDQGLFLLMVTALCLQLRRASGNERYAIGVCLHHRLSPTDKATLGPYFVFSALRVGMEEGDTFTTLYNRVAVAYRNMLRHYRHPVSAPPEERVWDVSINFVNKSFPLFAERNTQITWLQSGSYLAQEAVGLQIHHFNQGEGMTAEWDFNLGVFGTEDRRNTAMVDFEEAMEYGLSRPNELLAGFWTGENESTSQNEVRNAS